jgi:hypothetical protein
MTASDSANTHAQDGLGLKSAIAALSIARDNAATVHDCSELPLLLARHSEQIRNVLLIGYWDDSISKERYYIRSASFLVSNGTYQTLDQWAAADVLKGTDAPLKQLAGKLGAAFTVPVTIQRRNVYCIFEGHADPDADTLEAVADLYQKMLLTSLNLANSIDARNYHLSKPLAHFEIHPRFNSHQEICDALRTHFGIESSHFIFTGTRKRDSTPDPDDFRQYDNQTIDAVLPFYSIDGFKHRLNGSVKFKQPFIGHIDQAQNTHFCIFPAHDPSIRGSPVEGVVVVWSSSPIALAAYKAAGAWLRELSARRHMEKAKFLTELRRQVEDELTRTGHDDAPGRRARQEAVKRVSASVCRRICQLTNAEAATVRLLHDTKGLIRRYGSESTPLGEYRPDIQSQRPNLDIGIAEWDRSVVAFAFHYPGDETEIYIDDINRIPDKYQEHGLRGTLRVRDSTRCEAVLRVLRGGLLAAVINVESPIEGALQVEREFLRDCAAVMSDFLTRLETIGDRSGLATMAEMQIQIHAIKTDLMKWRKDQPDEAVRLLSRLKDNLQPQALTGSPLESAASVQLLNETLRGRIQQYLSDTSSDLSLTDVLQGHVPDDFPVAYLASLEVVLDSIWNNIIRNSLLQRNRLKISSTDQPFGLARVLTIQWDAPSRLPVAVDRDRLLLQPLTGPAGHHYGFFLIGVHTRLLGGHVELEEVADADFGFSIRAFIPYDPSFHQGLSQ